ncbi:MAG: AzlC family ABC transporter permease [Rhodobiaceae bacterium]|nr:AzlC family ABC transporter permease [Rhodobiaceae bacterium]
MDPEDETAAPDGRGSWGWFLRGLAGIVSAPALILMASFVGFGGLVRESGWSAGEAAMMTGMVWALPSQVVFVGSVAAGASLGATIIAVALSAVRLLPMTVALMPVLRDPKRSVVAYLPASHFIAITAWVVAMLRLPGIPREHRLAFFSGFGLALTSCNIGVTVLSHQLAGTVPPSIAAGLFFLTPIYFLVSLWSAARMRCDYLALLVGLALGPVFHRISPEFDILWVGILGGTLAYGIHRVVGRR